MFFNVFVSNLCYNIVTLDSTPKWGVLPKILPRNGAIPQQAACVFSVVHFSRWDDDSTASDTGGAMQIVTANGTFSYTEDWNHIERSRRPTLAAASLLPRPLWFVGMLHGNFTRLAVVLNRIEQCSQIAR